MMFWKTKKHSRAALRMIEQSAGFALESLEGRRMLSLPANPTGLAVATATPSTLALTWQDNANNENGFAIERLINGNWSPLNGNLAVNTQGYTDSGLAANTAYAYRVHAFNASGNSAYTFIGNAVTAPNVVTQTPPFAPYFLSAVANSSTQVSLTWYDNAGVETGVKVERKTGNGAFAEVATLAPHAQSYSDTAVAGGTTYTYRVTAFNGAGNSPYTNESAANTPGVIVTPTVPAAPTSLLATASSSSQIGLVWTDNANNETGYKVERQNGVTWTVIASLPANSTSFNDTGLTANTAYSFRVDAINTAGPSADSNISSATTQPGGVATSPPYAPYFLSATADSSTQVSLKWFDNFGVETGVKVERKTGNQAYGVIATLTPYAQVYVDTSALGGTAYTYRVAAVNTAGSSPYTNESSVTTPQGPGTPTPPTAPSSLNANASSSSQIDLSWTDNSSNETGFNVERLNGATWTVLTTLPANTTRYSDQGLAPATFYSYRVNAVNAVGPSAYAAVATVPTQAVIVTQNPPFAPYYLSAVANSGTQVTLNWFDNFGVETGVRVERQTANGPFTVVATLAPHAATYVDLTVAPSTTYTYRVASFNLGGNSPYTNTSSVTTQPGTVVMPGPTAPTLLSSVADSTSQITLNWIDNSNNETGFAVERQNGATWTPIVTVTANTTSFSDSSLIQSTSYTYRVRAVNANGASAYTNTSTATTKTVVITNAPTAPSGLAASVVSDTQLSLLWTDNSNNETSFNVERQNGANWTVVATLPANTTSYTDAGLTAATSYTYRVNAVNAGGPSAYTNASTATTKTVVITNAPAAPTGLVAATVSDTQLSLLWIDNSNNETGFNVERQNGASWTVVATLPANTTFYIDGGLTAATGYTYRVNAVNAGGPSAYTNLISATTNTTGGTLPRTDLTTFFPIGAFLQPTYTFSDWKARGVNTMVGFESYGEATSLEQWTQVANDRGLKYMREPLANPALDKTDPNLLSWLYPVDEPDLTDLATALPPAIKEFNLLRSIDPTRPIATTYAGGYILDWLKGVRDQAYYTTMAQYTDWVMPCIYPVTGWNQPENISGVGKLVDRVTQWFPGKRNIAYIETSNQNLPWVGPQERGVTPDEFRGEVWDAVIHGATGIVYFPHSLTPFNYDATSAGVAAEMTVQNARLSQYGANLLTTQNPAGTSISNNGAIETSWRIFNGKKYYFTLNLSANTVSNVSLATTGLAPSTTLAVDGESRNVTLQNGNIVDTFKPYEMHVYVA